MVDNLFDKLWDNLFDKGKKFIQLSFQEQWLLVVAMVLLPLVTIFLTLLGTNKTKFILTKLSPIPTSMDSNLKGKAKTIGSVVNIAASYCFFCSNCLRKSLVLWYLLRFNGIDSNICLGVRKFEGIFEAHAWVEYQGFVLNDNHNIRQFYKVFE